MTEHITVSRELLRQVLEWADDAVAVLSHTSSAIQGGIGAEAEGVGGSSVKLLAALRTALEQPAVEIVAYRFPKAGIKNGYHYIESLKGVGPRFRHVWEPLCAAPQLREHRKIGVGDPVYPPALQAQPVQEPIGYINHGTAYHTMGKTIFHKEPTKNLEKRWWTDDIPVFTAPQAQQPAPVQEPDRTGMRYYKDDSCTAASADSPDCICWTPITAPQSQPAVQEPVCDKDPQGCWNVRCQLGKRCKNTAPQAQPHKAVKLTPTELRALHHKHKLGRLCALEDFLKLTPIVEAAVREKLGMTE